MMMQMYLYWSTYVTLYFSWWTTGDSTTQPPTGDPLTYGLSLVAMLALGIGYEGLSVGHALISAKLTKARRENGYNLKDTVVKPPAIVQQLIVASLYIVRVILAYALMLAIMTYNGGVIICCFSGMFLGHFLFNRLTYQDGKEGFHELEAGSMGCH